MNRLSKTLPGAEGVAEQCRRDFGGGQREGLEEWRAGEEAQAMSRKAFHVRHYAPPAHEDKQ